jgi:endonuclease G
LLPAFFKTILPEDYTGSGFDRGHACDHEDRSATDAASYATFDMANIFPQAAELNRGPWADLESYCREVARAGYILHILTGGIGEGGIGDHGAARSIGKATRRVVVPAYCWKIILILDQTDALNSRSRLIAVTMPNTKGVTKPWTNYLTTTRQIEQLTGFTFFHDIPEAQQQRMLELKANSFSP